MFIGLSDKMIGVMRMVIFIYISGFNAMTNVFSQCKKELLSLACREQGAKNVPHGEQVQPKAVELKQCFVL